MNEPRPILDPGFRALFRAHAEYVMKSLRRLGVRSGDVDDLTHEVFLTVLRKWDTYDAGRPPKPWLFAFTVRIASAYRQSPYIRRERFQDVDVEEGSSPEGLFFKREQEGLVYRALDALDDDKRLVFTMFELDERSAVDIAAELAIPINTVFSRLRAARDEFTQAIKRLTREPPRFVRSASERFHVQ